MNKNKFDELAKGMAQSVTRRQALKRFSLGLAGMALACFGLPNQAEASACKTHESHCARNNGLRCCKGLKCMPTSYGYQCL
jgi:hypothetical protein